MHCLGLAQFTVSRSWSKTFKVKGVVPSADYESDSLTFSLLDFLFLVFAFFFFKEEKVAVGP